MVGQLWADMVWWKGLAEEICSLHDGQEAEREDRSQEGRDALPVTPLLLTLLTRPGPRWSAVNSWADESINELRSLWPSHFPEPHPEHPKPCAGFECQL